MKIMVAAHTAARIDAFILSPQDTSGNDWEMVESILTFSESDKKATSDLQGLQPFLCTLVIISTTIRIDRRGSPLLSDSSSQKRGGLSHKDKNPECPEVSITAIPVKLH